LFESIDIGLLTIKQTLPGIEVLLSVNTSKILVLPAGLAMLPTGRYNNIICMSSTSIGHIFKT
jgi:hypothetical protein